MEKAMETRASLQLIKEADNLAKCTGMDFRLCLDILHKAGGGGTQNRPEEIKNMKKGGT